MKSLKYIWRNVTRNKLRSMLTVLSISFSLALMTILYGYLVMQNLWGVEAAHHDRIVVMNIQGFSGFLPIAYVDRIRRVDGIEAAVPFRWFGGNYKDEQMPFSQFGTDAEQAFRVWSEYTIDPEQLAAWQRNRQGCVADRRLADRRGWQIGDRIPIKGTFVPFDLDLELVGVFDSPQTNDSIWFHWRYLDEGLQQMSARGTGNCGTIFAKAASAGVMSRVAKEIDDQYASSDNPTRTQTEQAFAQLFADMVGNVEGLILFIGVAVVFSLSLVAATTMAMSMRERTTEIAVLKAIGFSRGRVLWLVLGESCVIALLGGIVGVLLGCLCLQGLHGFSAQFFQFPVYEIIGVWMGHLLVVAAGIGLASGLVPAINAARLSVVNGLRRVV